MTDRDFSEDEASNARHATGEELSALADGACEALQAIRLRAHVAGCDSCAANYDDIANLRALVATIAEPPPAGARTTAVAMALASLGAQVGLGEPAGHAPSEGGLAVDERHGSSSEAQSAPADNKRASVTPIDTASRYRSRRLRALGAAAAIVVALAAAGTTTEVLIHSFPSQSRSSAAPEAIHNAVLPRPGLVVDFSPGSGSYFVSDASVARVEQTSRAAGTVSLLIVPKAGYSYSGVLRYKSIEVVVGGNKVAKARLLPSGDIEILNLSSVLAAKVKKALGQ